MKKIALALSAALVLAFGYTQATRLEKPTVVHTTPVADQKIVYLDGKKKDGTDKSFKDIISEFKGNVVYVDFWATWCGPCRMQFPYAKEVHKQLEGKKVVFLYVSFDRSEAAWKKGVEDMQLQGYHLFPNDNQKSMINNEFQVSSIPRYMLIDKKGNVVNADAKRPSTEGLVKDIEALL